MPPPRGSRALVALSGGPDSTALLLWLRESGADVAAAHYDHALRAGSERDAAHVAALCGRLGVPLLAERRTEPVPRGSLQAGARALRHAFLDRALLASARDVLCLGHTADDVVEGALLHLLRGSGLAGLRGMPERRGAVLRPLLDVWRSDVEAYLDARGVEALRDPANADTTRFARARVRLHLLPALERDRPGLTRRLRAAARAAARLHDGLEAAARALAGRGALRSDLAAAPRAVRLETYRQLFGHLPALDRRQLEAMDRLATGGPTGAGLDLPGGRRFRVEPDRVSIGVGVLPPAAEPALRARPCTGCASAGAAHLRAGAELTVGFRRPGLRMRPVGSPGTRKLQDILTDARVPRHLRDRLPLVFAAGRLAWVPGVAVDVDAAAPAGTPGLHVSIEWKAETLVVVSTSAHQRSPVT